MGKNLALLSGFNKSEKEEEKINKDIFLENVEVSISDDIQVNEFLKDQSFKINKIMSKSYTELGEIFKETQEKLGKNGYGTFYKWFTFIGFKKDKVYSLINRSNLIVGFSDKRELIESLPVTLSYEISKESCPDWLRDKVLHGEIHSLKELKAFLLENKNEFQEVEIIDFNNIYSDFKSKIDNLPQLLNKLPENKKLKIEKEIEKLYLKIEKLM